MLNGIKKSETEWEIKNPPKVNGGNRQRGIRNIKSNL